MTVQAKIASRLARLGKTLSVLAFVTACSVVDSAPVVEVHGYSGVNGYSGGCKSRLGSYSLPKSVIHARILRTGETGRKFHVIEELNTEPVPDNNHTYCLDHLANGFADDSVRVFKETITYDEKAGETVAGKTSTPFLQLIASRATDETVAIARKLIRTAFILASGAPNFTVARSASIDVKGSEYVADIRFDPFDQDEVAEINASTRKFGFCFVLLQFSYDVHSARAQQYCNDPLGTLRRHRSSVADKASRQRALQPKRINGVFYRPPASYRLAVYVKSDPGGPDRWRLGLLRNVSLENISPVISVGVDRSLFSTRRTGLVFKDGVLTNVCIAKGAGAAEFLNIPLDIVYGVIALPSQTINAAISNTETRRKLIEAQQRLIDAQNEYIGFLEASSDDQKAKYDPKSNPEGTSLDLGETGVPGFDQNKIDAAFKPRKDLSGNTAEITGIDSFLSDNICPELQAANQGTAPRFFRADRDDEKATGNF